MRPAVSVVLADLDDTLFDHSHATRRSLMAVREVAEELKACPLDELEARHREILEELHVKVLDGALTIDAARLERFGRLLRDCGAADFAERAQSVAMTYRHAYAASWEAVPGALDLVRAIKTRGLALVIITNNNIAEQQLKLERCGLAEFVDALVTPEHIDARKPDPRIFAHALTSVRLDAVSAVMLGDAWATDIEGAKTAGVRPVWLNRTGETSRDPAVQELRSLEPTSAALGALLIPAS